MAASGKDWVVALARVTQSRHRAARASKLLEDAKSGLVRSACDDALHQLIMEAKHELSVAQVLIDSITLAQLKRRDLG